MIYRSHSEGSPAVEQRGLEIAGFAHLSTLSPHTLSNEMPTSRKRAELKMMIGRLYATFELTLWSPMIWWVPFTDSKAQRKCKRRKIHPDFDYFSKESEGISRKACPSRWSGTRIIPLISSMKSFELVPTYANPRNAKSKQEAYRKTKCQNQSRNPAALVASSSPLTEHRDDFKKRFVIYSFSATCRCFVHLQLY